MRKLAVILGLGLAVSTAFASTCGSSFDALVATHINDSVPAEVVSELQSKACYFHTTYANPTTTEQEAARSEAARKLALDMVLENNKWDEVQQYVDEGVSRDKAITIADAKVQAAGLAEKAFN